MKKVIAIMLAVVLVAGGLGSVAYANAEPVSRVQLDFHSSWIYESWEDIFENLEVTGERKWFAAILESEGPVIDTELSLTSNLPLEWFHPEPTSIEPQDSVKTYQWSFGHVSWAKAGVGFYRPDPFPVTFSPGFDASRTIVDNKTVFLQSEGTQTQTLNITVTPRDSTRIDMRVQAPENELVNPVITSPPTDELQGIWLSPDGHDLQIFPKDLQLGTTWTIPVTIEVTPKVSRLKYIPFVEVHQPGPGPWAFGEATGSSFPYEVPELGTWIWSATGTYDWHWSDGIVREVHWPRRCREMPVAQASVDLYLAPVGSDFTFDGNASSGAIVSYDWDFGDGNVETGMTPTHAYALPGLYNVVLTVTDDRGAQSTDSVMAVVYDPDAGFVTGGGWIYSEAGADLVNPSAEGKAAFGFVSKYKKGATEPTGQTEFQFKAGDLNFHSTEYEWLVVNQSGTNAQFKGTGTINGTGEYKFMLWAGDDDPDTFRIRIWEEDEYGNEVERYDNGFDQTIAGGNIVIHAKK